VIQYYIGIDVGGTKIAYGLFNNERLLVKTWRQPASKEAECVPFFDDLISQVQQILEGLDLSPSQLGGVGVGMPSYIDQNQGRIIKTANLNKIRDFDARSYLQDRLQTRVVLGNDANAAALAEFYHGAGRGLQHMIYCPISTGCSSAIIINGKLFQGAYGWAGESSHGIITPDDNLLCGCGNRGCYMSHISGSMIVKRIQARIAQGETTSMLDLVDGNPDKITAEHLLVAARAGDNLALQAVDHMAFYLGLWLFNLYQTLNIPVFVFGGGLINFGDMLFDKAKEIFNQYENTGYPVEFRFAKLGADTGTIGAMELLFHT
jgi:glucokinase